MGRIHFIFVYKTHQMSNPKSDAAEQMNLHLLIIQLVAMRTDIFFRMHVFSMYAYFQGILGNHATLL